MIRGIYLRVNNVFLATDIVKGHVEPEVSRPKEKARGRITIIKKTCERREGRVNLLAICLRINGQSSLIYLFAYSHPF